MKTSRLAAQAIPCRDAHLRVSARPLSTGIRRFIPIGHLVKFAALVATCAIAVPLEAASVKLAWNPNPESDIAGYRLSYGTSSGNHPITVETGNVTTTTVSGLAEGQTYYFVVRAVNTSGLVSDPSQEISHTVPVSNLISRTGWRVHYVDSEEAPNDAGAMAIDGDPNTFWHTAWKNGTTPPPHEIQIDLGSVQSMAGFRYLPRQDSYINGNIADYEFYVSMDGVNWGSPVATGTFANTKAEKEVLFPSTSGRYVRLRQLSEVAGQNHCSVAELNLVQGEIAPVQPPENRAPVASSQSVTTQEDEAVSLTLAASDPDGDSLTWQIVTQPSMGTLSGAAPNLTYTPHADANGSDSFTFRVSDGDLTSNTATVSITVALVNDAPVAAASSVATAEDTAVGILLSATDKDGDSLAYRVVSQPSKGTLSGTPPNLTYTPGADYNGSDSFAFRANDGTADSASTSVSITITPVNDAPVAVARMVSSPADTPVAITLVATDKDGDPLSYRIVSQPVKGKLSGTPPNLTYTPGQGVSGSDSLSFRVNDGNVNSNTATVSITLTAPLSDNRPPVFQTTRISRSTGTAGRDYSCTSLEGCATDPDGDSVAYEKTAGPEWLTVGPDGSIAGTPPEDATGRNAFIIRARDPEGAYADALLEIQVQSTSLPQPWDMQRFGSTGEESIASGDGLSFTLTGSGALAGKSDSGLLTWQPLTEDGDITARITSLEGMGSASRIGLMIRETLLEDSKHTFIGADGRGYVRWVRRTRTGGNTSISTVSLTDPLNLWLRLSREGGTITAFTSADGSSWTRVGSANIDLGASCYIGLSVSSGSTTPGTAVFDNVTVTP